MEEGQITNFSPEEESKANFKVIMRSWQHKDSDSEKDPRYQRFK
jgi:hypothetical protein